MINLNYIFISLSLLTADNIKWVTLVDIENKKVENKKRFDIDDEVVYNRRNEIKTDENAIVQLRLNGEYVRRYIDIDEIIEMHPIWNDVDIMMSLTDFMPEAYGYRWVYETNYHKQYF